MDTRSKSTNVFKGVISWLSMLALLLCATGTVTFLVLMLFRPEYLSELTEMAADFSEKVSSPSLRPADPAFQQLIYLFCVFVLLLILFIFTFGFRRDRKQVEGYIAGFLGKIWMEIKVVFILSALAFGGMSAYYAIDWIYYYRSFGEELCGYTLLAYLVLLLLYFLCLDVGRNKRFFSHNIIHSILKGISEHENFTTFQEKSLARVYACIGVIAALLVVGAIYAIGMNDALLEFPLISLAVGGALFTGVIGTVVWYIVTLKKDLKDWNVLMEQIREMYGGDMDAVNNIPPTSNIYDCAMQLNMIRIGIQQAVAEGIKADRTKVELITNVSHDIKTPLTSIISYIELLKKEEDLPPHVMDYVNTISTKADRLSHIVQDVFDVSKAATGNIALDLSDLDIGKLLQQTYAEMQEYLDSSGITWRMDIPEEPVLVHADGQRLYRVFQNLFKNCAQYSLEGSRAYVNLSANDSLALVTVKNVSRSEITMNGSDLTARFVRGDETRSTEGSGLGLSIAKSFTEACGGSFGIQTEGDLFTVTVAFPRVIKQQPSLELTPVPSEQ